MRDSSLKRFLVGAWLSALEVRNGLRGMYGQSSAGPLTAPDYDSYWRLRPSGTLQPRFEIIAKHLKAEATLLDVGCGDGAMLRYLAETARIRGIGIDISKVAVETARRRGVDARVQTLADLRAERGSSGFDHVVVSEVLEHVADPETLVRQAWELARTTLWLTFPNIAYFPHRLRLLTGKFPIQWAVFPGEHLRFWSIPDFCHWLAQLGMNDPTLYPSNGLIVFRLHRAWPNLFANQVVVRLEKS